MEFYACTVFENPDSRHRFSFDSKPNETISDVGVDYIASLVIIHFGFFRFFENR